jgi:hypothetical protein
MVAHGGLSFLEWKANPMTRDEALKLTPAEWREYVMRTTRAKAAAEKALKAAMTGPTSGGIANQLAPVVLRAIITGKVPGVVWRAP